MTALAVSACTGHDANRSEMHGTAAADAWDGLELARIGTVGAFPAEEHVLLRVAADGALTCNGEPVASLRALEDALVPLVRSEPTYPSTVPVVVAADARVAWSRVACVLSACAGPKVQVSRTFFACRHEGSGEPGAFAAFLPQDRGISDGAEPRGCVVARATVRIGRAAGVTDPLAVAAWLAAMPSTERPFVELDAVPDAPFGFVLRTADAVARGGAPALLFSARSCLAALRAEEARPGAPSSGDRRPWTVSIRDVDLARSHGTLPVPRLLTDAYAGFALERLADWPESQSEEEWDAEPDEAPPLERQERPGDADAANGHSEPPAPDGPR